MNTQGIFSHPVTESQAEKASNSYLMSLVAIMTGMFLPLFNMLATLIFYLANRKEALFVRWHCTQALFAQLILVVVNSIGFIWLLSILFGSNSFTNPFFAYLAVLLITNLIEFIATIYTAIQTRKGKHVEWWFIGPLTNSVVKPPVVAEEPRFGE